VNVAGNHVNTISTKRLTLRPLRADDLVNLAAACNNQRIARNLAYMPWPYDLDDARAFYDFTLTLSTRSAIFAVFERNAATSIIGMVGYEKAGLETEIGYWVSEPWWGKGIVSEAATVAVEHAFQVTGIDRLQGRCFLGNERSRRVLVGLGFRPTQIGSTFSVARRSHVVSQHFELTCKEWRFGRGHRKP
jgi:RimJ/RimL family protein N-acetyltransferase